MGIEHEHYDQERMAWCSDYRWTEGNHRAFSRR